MNNEIKEIIEYFKDDIDFLEVELKHPEFKGRYITIRDKECEYLRKLLDYITNLQEKVNQYENPDDLTLFYMWLDEKAKDKMKKLQEENKHLDEVNCHLRKKINNDDFDETMKDIKDNLIARINRQECEIHNLKAKLEMYENGVYFSSENDKLQEKIDKAREFIENNKLCICKEDEGMIFTAFVDDELLNILKGSDKE